MHFSGKVDNGLKLLFRVSTYVRVLLGVHTHWSKRFRHKSWVLSTRSKTGQRTYKVVPSTRLH